MRKFILAIGLVVFVALAGGIGYRTVSSQPSPPEVLSTVNNRILASHGLVLRPTAGRAQPDEATSQSIKRRLKEMNFPTDFAEPPVLVKFAEPIPGIPATQTDQMWAVVLSAEFSFGGGPNGVRPNPDSTGTYWVAFYSPKSDKIEYAVAGERVLK